MQCRELRIGPHLLRSNVLLAPMAGVTDAPFRRLVRRYGAGLTCSEMIASGALLASDRLMRAKAEIDADDALPAVQLAGRDPAILAEAAKRAEQSGARIIDINMGCPAKKVTGGYAGSALMREPELALRLIEAVVAAVEAPVTVKMRLGWDKDVLNAPEIAARAEEAGGAMVAVHGRTRRQFYKGAADWRAVGAVVRRVSVPVLVNGDITDVETAKTALRRSGAAGLMIGRGAVRRPWALAEIAAALGATDYSPPSLATQIEDLSAQYEAMLSFYGSEIGLRVARKHLNWRLEGATPAGKELRGRKELRARMMRSTSPKEVVSMIAQALGEGAAAQARPTA